MSRMVLFQNELMKGEEKNNFGIFMIYATNDFLLTNRPDDEKQSEASRKTRRVEAVRSPRILSFSLSALLWP